MYQNPQAMFNPYAQNIAIIKNYFKKPIVLVNAISGAISIAILFFSSLYISAFADEMIYYIFGGANNVTREISNVLNSSIVGYNVSMLIMPTLTVIAFFILYYKSKDESPTSTPSAGASILSVVSLIQLIFVCIGLGLLLLTFMIMLIVVIATGSSTDDETQIAIIGLSISLIVMLALCAFILLFFINQRRYYKSVKEGLSSPTLSTKGAGFFGVTSIIMGAISALNVGQSILSILMMGMSSATIEQEIGFSFDNLMPYMILTTVASLFSAIHVLLTGIIANGYNKYIKSIAFSYSAAPMYAYPQPFGPVAPVQPPAPTQTITNPFDTADDSTVPIDRYHSDDTIICPNCKKQLPKEIIFCDSCGNKVQ